MTRIILLLAALASAVALAACGGSAGETVPVTTAPPAEPTTAGETAPATTEEVEPATTAEPATTEEARTETETETEPPADAAVTLAVEIAGGQAVGGTQTLEVKSGERVRITISVDADDELHLHGYDIEKVVTPSKPAVFAFRADIEGIFELESHLAEAAIVKLVVSP